ncbi:MAG TPA: SRPBCC domain-containing protein, partial [Streptosporangiaceae bacterium]|nr:SRPBCC domain-containing protein [Streptosporangiaceae bacterium]
MPTLQRQPGPDYAAHVTVGVPIETAFAAISTVDGLRGWWTEHTDGSAEPGGKLRFEFPKYEITKFMRVEESTRPTLVRWICAECSLPEWVGTELTFELTEADPARTELRFTHAGLQPQLECYGSCSAGWDYYLRSLASYLETGTGQPYRPINRDLADLAGLAPRLHRVAGVGHRHG